MAHRSITAATGQIRRATYLTILNEQLERRRRDHGHAFLTPTEDAWLQAQGLRQTGRYADLEQFGDIPRGRRTRGTPASGWSRANG